MNPGGRIFLTNDSHQRLSSESVLHCREALTRLFPKATPVSGPCERLVTPSCYFLRDGETSLWIEMMTSVFTRQEICDYLAKAREIQPFFASGITGVLAAPDFESGSRELLELIEFPIRCFRYREAVPLGPAPASFPRGAVLWIESVPALTVPVENFPEKHVPAFEEKPLPEFPAVETVSSCHRLNREELREFIQLELDALSNNSA